MPEPSDIEHEFGVAIPGRILPVEQWARTALKRLPPGPLNWEAIFGRVAPVVLDLGCGNGRYTLHSALTRPDFDHLASDVLPAVIRYATRRANQRGLSNARFAVKDAQTLLARHVADSSVAEVHVYHPQPYHEPGLAHLRLLTGPFLAEVHRVLGPGGLFVVQTDHPDYWDYLRGVVPRLFVFEEVEGPWPDAPGGRSRREIVARGRGLRIYRGQGRRRDELDPAVARRIGLEAPRPMFRSRGPWDELDEREGGSRP